MLLRISLLKRTLFVLNNKRLTVHPRNLLLKIRGLSFIVPFVYCSSNNIKKLELPACDDLSHKFLLKQASSATATSACSLLNHTISAIIDTAALYKKALNDLMSLIEECKASLENEALQQEASDLMVVIRSDVNTYKSQFTELESLFEYVEKVVVSATETSFLLGAEYISTSLSEQLYSAQQEVLRTKKSIQALEHEYFLLQQSYIKSSDSNKKDKNKLN